jgi:hypothetical protein
MMRTVSERKYGAALAALLIVGVGIRLVVAWETDGVAFDLQSFAEVNTALHHHGFSVYDAIHPARWPYPPGYFPWVLAAGKIGQHADFIHVIRLPAIAADAGIALIVQDLLRRAGARRARGDGQGSLADTSGGSTS